jgi:hypothetical protein
LRLENYFINPDFSNNGVENARDGSYAVTFGTGKRLERAASDALRPTGLAENFTVHAIVKPTDASGSKQIIAHCSDTWELSYTPNDDRFRFQLKDGASANILVGDDSVGASAFTPTPNASGATHTLTGHEVDAGNDRVLVVNVVVRSESGAAKWVTSITRNGVAFSLAARARHSTGVSAEQWYLINPAVGIADIIVTLESAENGIVVHAINLTGVNQSVPTGGVATYDNSADNDPDVTVVSDPSEVVIDCLGTYSALSVPAEGGGQTELANDLDNFVIRLSSSWKTGAASTNMTWNTTGGPIVAMVAVSYKPVAGGYATVTSIKEFSDDIEYAVTVTLLRATGDNDTAAYLMMFVNGELVGITTHGLSSLSQAAGTFAIGAKSDDTLNFNGNVCGFAIIKRTLWPWQIKLLFKYGMRSLIRGVSGLLTGTPPGHDYWDFSDAEYGAVWIFDQSSGNQNDSGPGALTLTAIGSPTTTYNRRGALGWTHVNPFASPTTVSEISSAQAKYGRFSVHLVRGSSANPAVNQVISIPAYKRGAGADQDWDLTFWLNLISGQFKVYIEDQDTNVLVDAAITSLGLGMVQYGVRFNHEDTSTALTVILRTNSASSEAYVSAPMLSPGNQFGLPLNTPALQAAEIPFIGSRFGHAIQSGGKGPHLSVYGLPGDGPVATRTFIENT